MANNAALGIGEGLDGREAGLDAVQKALNALGTQRPAAGVVLFSQEFDGSELVHGISGMLGNIPLWGFGSPRILHGNQDHPRRAAVLLLGGAELRARGIWLANYGKDGKTAAAQIGMQMAGSSSAGLLIAADGVQGDCAAVCGALTELPVALAGGLAVPTNGELCELVGSGQTAGGALSALELGGRARLGVGIGSGWRDVGLSFAVEQVEGLRVTRMDGRTPAEVYEGVFGAGLQDWRRPPLADLIRLYPLGIEEFPGSSDLSIRTPVRMDADGSLRMNAPVEAGVVARLMVGDPEACVRAAQNAAEEAVTMLGGAAPAAALVFADVSWQYLFESQSPRFLEAVQGVVGKQIPLAGAYTLGQVVRTLSEKPPQALNQQIQVVLIGTEAG